MHGIFALLVLLAVGEQYVSGACTDANGALAELAICLEARIADMESMSVNKDDVCQTATTINTYLSPCPPLVANCSDAEKQTGTQQVTVAEQKITEKCAAHEKDKMCQSEMFQCLMPLMIALTPQQVDLSQIMTGVYNATQQAEICTLIKDISTDEIVNCLEGAREKEVCKVAEAGNSGPMGQPTGPDGEDPFVYSYKMMLSVCDEECKDLKTKVEKFGFCINSTSYLTDLIYINQKAMVSNQTTGIESQCKSVTDHLKACYADFECCPTLMGQAQIMLQAYIPKTACPEMQNTLKEQCSKDTPTTTVKTISSTETSKASQMTTSMLVLSGTLALWAFLRA